MPVKVHVEGVGLVEFPDGMSDAEMEAAIKQLPTAQAAPAQGKSVSGFLGNVASSGGRFLLDTLQGLPALAKLAGHAAAGVANPNHLAALARDASVRGVVPQMAGAVKDAAAQRYGSREAIGNTLYNDPVGVLADVSTAAGIGAATRAPRIAGALGKVSAATNPMSAVGAAAKAVTRPAARTVVASTLRPSAAIRNDFGGRKGVADAVLDERVYSEASAQRKLSNSTAKADSLVSDAEAAGTPGVRRRDVAKAVMGDPQATAQTRVRLGVPDATPELKEVAKGIIANNPVRIKLTDAQRMKREAQTLAYEAGVDNNSVKKAAEIAKAKALREGIEQQVPEVGPVNQQSQRLLGSQLAFAEAQDRPPGLSNMLALGAGSSAAAGSGDLVGGLLVAAAMKALNSPRGGALAGIGIDSIGRGLNAQGLRQAALLARLAEQEP